MKKQLLADHQKHTPYNKNECADTFCGLQIFAEMKQKNFCSYILLPEELIPLISLRSNSCIPLILQFGGKIDNKAWLEKSSSAH